MALDLRKSGVELRKLHLVPQEILPAAASHRSVPAPRGGNQAGTVFVNNLNRVLERENAGYRFINKIISPIVSDQEIASIEVALSLTDRFKPVSAHLSIALKLFSDRKSPDYRNSIKDSISAVEAMCQIITGDSKATLGQAVRKLEDWGIKLHPAFEGALQKMYGYTSDAEGIRHALLDEPTLDADDARFMLVSCSAFVNYLKAKASAPQ